ncbi:Afg1l [Symbiodinium natans]|uniref:Afg1l protein n=1 Tax=Symbiodinium natans TaxID=878477 RepID=A0A812M774_9DINO|nr:Afg1l [Symbiodinium natans]
MRSQRGGSGSGATGATSDGQVSSASISTAPAERPPTQAVSRPAAAPRKPQKSSVYMHGPVGTGKTMLMDLFYDHARGAGLRTLRRHFYEFMMGLHRQIHQIQQERPVEVAANSLADDIDVLCFDEFQITDIQDAAILPRLFEVLFLRGVTVVMTSNTSPQLLYSGGLNRHVHLPSFINVLARSLVHRLPYLYRQKWGPSTFIVRQGYIFSLGPSLVQVDYRRRAEAAELAEAARRGRAEVAGPFRNTRPLLPIKALHGAVEGTAAAAAQALAVGAASVPPHVRPNRGSSGAEGVDMAQGRETKNVPVLQLLSRSVWLQNERTEMETPKQQIMDEMNQCPVSNTMCVGGYVLDIANSAESLVLTVSTTQRVTGSAGFFED